MTALNPVYTMGNQIEKIIRKHKKVSKQEAKLRAVNLLKSVGIPCPTAFVKEHPHSHNFRWNETTCHDCYGNFRDPELSIAMELMNQLWMSRYKQKFWIYLWT